MSHIILIIILTALFSQWWITSASRVAELKLRIIDALLDGLASFLEDYNTIVNERRDKDGRVLADENAIIVQFAALFHLRKQPYAFKPTTGHEVCLLTCKARARIFIQSLHSHAHCMRTCRVCPFI